MDLLWPSSLFLLAAVPVVIAAYIWMLRRRRKNTLRYSSLSLVRAAQPQFSRVRRHLPFALFLLAFASLVLALTRPVSIVPAPADQATIILAMDVSGSMRAQDIPPSRLWAAKEAALSFVRRQSSSSQIGIVAFARFAELVQPPTNNQKVLEDAIISLTTGRGTAVGSAILRSIDSIAEFNPNVAPIFYDREDQASPVPNGAYIPAIIVVLTDGVSTGGPSPLDVAQFAVDRGIRIYTIGFGTPDGFIEFGGGQFQGNEPNERGRFRTGIDENVLQAVADLTGGEYYTAESAEELQSVFDNLPTSLILRHDVIEISVAFVALGALLAISAVLLSMWWNPMI